MDIGATHHLTNDIIQLQNPSPYFGNASVILGNGSTIPISQTDTNKLSCTFHKLNLNDLLLVPQLEKNLILVKKLCEDNNVFVANKFLCEGPRNKTILLHGGTEQGFYKVGDGMPLSNNINCNQAPAMELCYMKD